MTFVTTSLSSNTACFISRKKRACIVIHVIQADKRHQKNIFRASQTQKQCSFDHNGSIIKEVCSIIQTKKIIYFQETFQMFDTLL
jgi:hypothetical protein